MKKIVIKLFLLQIVFLNTLVGQWCNDGADIFIGENAFIHLQGDFTIQGGTICNEGTIELGGNLTNTSTVTAMTPGRGQVLLVGTDHVLDGNVNTLFNQLIFNGDQNLTLNRTAGILNSIDLGDGLISIMEGFNLHLLSSSNSALQFGTGGVLDGFVRWDIGVEAEGEYVIPFINESQSNIPLSFEVNEQGVGDDGYLQIRTYGTTNDNTPTPPNVTNIDINGVSTGLNLVDRFWIVNAVDYTEEPETSVNLSFDEAQEASGTNTFDLNDIGAVVWDEMSSSWTNLISDSESSNTINALLNDNYGELAVFGALTDGGDGDGNMGDQAIVHYSLNACSSFSSRGTQIDYSEFTPGFPNTLSCATVTAENVHRISPETNQHSCTPGINDSAAMCVSTSSSCMFEANSERAIRFSVTLNPTDGSESVISGLSFYEKAPTMFDWISGPSGMNDYPTRYGIRVLKNGMEIFSEVDIEATEEWTLESFNFTGDEFNVTEPSTFDFELLGYCTVGNGAEQSVWDVDEIFVIGRCEESSSVAMIAGSITTPFGDAIDNVQVTNNSLHPEFPVMSLTDDNGSYAFNNNVIGEDYVISAEREDNYANGVTILDLILIQRHIVGTKSLDSPYKMIAADADDSGTITGADFFAIMRRVLGFRAGQDNSDSWKFISAESNIDMNSPFSYSTEIENRNLSTDNLSNNFIGIKMGDVTGDALSNSDQTTTRSNAVLQLNYQDRMVERGEMYNVDIKGANFEEILGFQFTTELEGIELMDVKAKSLNFTEDNIARLESDLVTVAYSSINPLSVDNSDALFTIRFKAVESGQLSDMLTISDSRTYNVAYTNQSFDELTVSLEEIEIHDNTNQFQVFQNYPNPFSDYTNISFNLENDNDVELKIYDLLGKQIYTKKASFSKGYNVIRVEKADMDASTGTLIYSITGNGFTDFKKMSYTSIE